MKDMITYFNIPIAIFYIFLSLIYFSKIENKILKLIVCLFGIFGFCFLAKIVFPNDILKYIIFFSGFLASILLLIYSVKKRHKIILVLFIVPFILAYVAKGMHLPFVPITSILKIFSLALWIYFTIANHKRGDDEMEQEVKVINFFAIELILGLIGMINYGLKTWV
jgi:hypothetical protein